MSEVSEKLFLEQVIQLLKINGWLYFHPSPHKAGEKVWRTDGAGFPDLVCVHPQHGCIWAELKTMEGRLSPLQKVWGNVLKNVGQEYYVWRPNQIQLIADRLSGKV